MVLTEGSQGRNASKGVKEMRAKQLKINTANSKHRIYDCGYKWTYYRGLLDSRSSNLSCLEVRR